MSSTIGSQDTMKSLQITIKRIYQELAFNDGNRIAAARLWPRDQSTMRRDLYHADVVARVRVLLKRQRVDKS